MQNKLAVYKIKGMNKDLSYSAFNPEFSWHNHNVRLTARDGSNLLAVTNEKGNVKVTTTDILGESIGSCAIGNTLVVFTCERLNAAKDRIYKLDGYNPITQTATTTKLFEGTLGFSVNNPIQGLPFYENEDVQKVYWVDGKNQTRVINVMDTTTIYNNESFDFVKKLALTESVTVTKSDTGGLFKSGTVQYAMTYYNLNGSESNIFYTSPLNYISPAGRGGAPDEIVANSFSISITGLDKQFSYLRIYSIYRSSKDVISEVKRVVDLSIPASATLTYIDGNTSGSTLSSDVLLYIGGEELIAGCIVQKSNTMFLGNIKTLNEEIPLTLTATSDITTTVPVHNSVFSWLYEDPFEQESTIENTSYPYNPSLTIQNSRLTFKYGETYRFGIQGQYENGKWSAPIWLGYDSVVDKRYRQQFFSASSSVYTSLIKGVLSVNTTLSGWFTSKGFLKVRPVMVPLTMADRTYIAQGLVNNTLFEIRNRLSANSTTLDWSFPDYLLRNNGKTRDERPTQDTAPDGEYIHHDIIKVSNPSYIHSLFVENVGVDGDSGEDPMNLLDLTSYDKQYFGVDKNFVNFWSPEITYNNSAIEPHLESVNTASLYGFAIQTGRQFDFEYEFVGSTSNTPNNMTQNVNNYGTSSLLAPLKSEKLSVTSTNVNSTDTSTDHILTSFWQPNTVDQLVPYDLDDAAHGRFIRMTATNNKKSGLCYYGYNSCLTYGVNKSYIIKTPKLLINESVVNVALNSSHGVSGRYKKAFSQLYTQGTFCIPFNVGGNHAWRITGSTEKRSISEIKFNTANHIAFSFGKIASDQMWCMPRIKRPTGDTAGYQVQASVPTAYYGSIDGPAVGQFVTEVVDGGLYLDPAISDERARLALPIFELSKTVSPVVRYGGFSADAIVSNTWIPCGKAVAVSSEFDVEFTDGDVFFRRYDLKRVYPDNINQVGQHTELVSFMCESFVNTDGRYDTHRKEVSSTVAASYNNYGSVNTTYSQADNYFNYTALNPLLFSSTEFPVTIAWSNVKTSGSAIDNWTNMTSARSLDLDGVYGAISSINLINNDIYVFQPKGIARLLYNERISQKASDGLAIEVANGYKVPEYRYITNQYGCSNRDSIVEGKGGIYFIDFINKTLCSIGDGVKDLGYEKGFKSWFNTNVLDTKPFTLSYDKMNNDLYIHNEDYCLNYSEVLQLFASFYDYTGIGRMRNIWGKNLSVKYDGATASGIWIHSDGAYNMFYDYQQPFSVEYTLSPEPTSDKVFNSFEYRLDSRNTGDIDINQVEATNWYQKGKISSSQFSANMKSKFNVNRVLFPRDNDHVSPEVNYPLNRIRSTWAKLKISHVATQTNVDKKFVMQDLAVSYSV